MQGAERRLARHLTRQVMRTGDAWGICAMTWDSMEIWDMDQRTRVVQIIRDWYRRGWVDFAAHPPNPSIEEFTVLLCTQPEDV